MSPIEMNIHRTREENPVPDTTAKVPTEKERSAVYTKAMRALREKHREEFDELMQKGYADIGFQWTPPKRVEFERDKATFLALMQKHPELRDLADFPGPQDAEPPT